MQNTNVAENSLFEYLFFLVYVILFHSLLAKIYVRMDTSIIMGKS
jgi:hypothetical protein